MRRLEFSLFCCFKHSLPLDGKRLIDSTNGKFKFYSFFRFFMINRHGRETAFFRYPTRPDSLITFNNATQVKKPERKAIFYVFTIESTNGDATPLEITSFFYYISQQAGLELRLIMFWRDQAISITTINIYRLTL